MKENDGRECKEKTGAGYIDEDARRSQNKADDAGSNEGRREKMRRRER